MSESSDTTPPQSKLARASRKVTFAQHLGSKAAALKGSFTSNDSGEVKSKSFGLRNNLKINTDQANSENDDSLSTITSDVDRKKDKHMKNF